MSQWGRTRTFRAGETHITVIPHITTDGPMTSADLVDSLHVVNVASDDAADELLQPLIQRYVGRPYRDWLLSELV